MPDVLNVKCNEESHEITWTIQDYWSDRKEVMEEREGRKCRVYSLSSPEFAVKSIKGDMKWTLTLSEVSWVDKVSYNHNVALALVEGTGLPLTCSASFDLRGEKEGKYTGETGQLRFKKGSSHLVELGSGYLLPVHRPCVLRCKITVRRT